MRGARAYADRRGYFPGRYAPARGYGSAGYAAHARPTAGGFPADLAALNAIFATWSATFSQAWNFEEASGNAASYATSGAISLVPQGTAAPTQGVSTGLPGGDKGVQFGDNTNQRMEAGASGNLDVSTGDVWMLGTTRLLLSTAGRAIMAKYLSTTFYRIVTVNTGQIQFALSGTGGASTLTVAVDHSGAAYFDWLAIRSGGNMGLITNLGDAGTAVDNSGNITNTGLFCAGRNFGSASSIHTFLAWGTAPGSVLANRAAALAAWRAARGAA